MLPNSPGNLEEEELHLSLGTIKITKLMIKFIFEFLIYFGGQDPPHQSFKKYITDKKDFNELLLHLMRGLLADAIRFEVYAKKIICYDAMEMNSIPVIMEHMDSIEVLSVIN